MTYISGAPEDIKPEMTAYIGSTVGGQEFGRIRVRSASAGQIDVAENSIEWQENWYITVVEFYEPWSVFPRIVLDANNIPVFYKDYDIAYTDQNKYLEPIVVMGPNHAGFLETGSHSVFYSSIGSFDPTPDNSDLLLTGASYSWQFGDVGFVDPTGTTDQNPGWVTYHSGGFYTTDLEITNVHGESFMGHRHVMIYDRPGEGPERPYIKWGMNSVDGSREEGGYRVRIWLREEAGFSKVKDGSLVVIFSDDWQGSNEGAIGGNAEHRDSIFFSGYIDRGTISLDSITNKLEFQVSGLTSLMREISNYSVSLESKKSADTKTWYQIRDMTVDRAIIHLLRWQSTVLALSDFHQTGDTLPIQYADFDRGSLYDTANQFLGSTIAAQMVGDRQGALYCEVDFNLIPTGTSRDGYLVALGLERRDWRSRLAFDFVPNSTLAYIEMGGIGYSGPQTGTTEAYLAGAPGDAQLWRGNIERGSGLVLSGQDGLNILTANMLAQANSEFPDMEVPLAGDYRFIEIAPQRLVTVTLDEDETYRGFVWDEKRFIPIGMSFHYDATRQSLMTDLTIKEETFAVESGKADTIIIPVDPPYTNYKLPEWSLEFPPFLPPEPIIPPIIGPPTFGNLVYVLYEHVLARTRNFWSIDPAWETVTIPADLAESSNFSLLRLNPTDPRNTAYLISEYSGDYTIYRTYNLDAAVPTWELIFSATDSSSLLGSVPALCHMGVWLNGLVISVGGFGGKDCLPGNQCPKFIRSTDGGNTWTEAHNGAWQSKVLSGPMMVQVPFFGVGTMYASRSGEGRLWKSIDVAQNFTQKYFDPPVWVNSNPHPSGETIYATGNVVLGVPTNRELKISIDGGDNWTSYPLQHRGNYMAPYGDTTIPGDRSDTLHYHPTADAHFGMVAGGGVSTFAIFDNNAWIPLWDFSGEIYPYMLHYGNADLHYALGNASDGEIIGSNDRGSTWYDKEGDFATAVMAWALTGGKMSVQPVHNA